MTTGLPLDLKQRNNRLFIKVLDRKTGCKKPVKTTLMEIILNIKEPGMDPEVIR